MSYENNLLVSRLMSDLEQEQEQIRKLYNIASDYLSDEYKARAVAELETEGIDRPEVVLAYVPKPHCG